MQACRVGPSACSKSRETTAAGASVARTPSVSQADCINCAEALRGTGGSG